MQRSFVTELSAKLNLNRLPKSALVGCVALLVIVLGCVFGMIHMVASKEHVVVESSAPHALAVENDSQEDQSIYVHVSGAVLHPGLIELKAEDRVASAIEAAGGFTSDADTSSVNLARVLSDGEQLFIAQKITEGTDQGALEEATSVSSSTSTGALAAGGYSSRGVQGKVNINTATVAQLIGLPGIGESTANKIINDRMNNGPFNKIEDLTRVSGIGDKKFEAIRDLICV